MQGYKQDDACIIARKYSNTYNIRASPGDSPIMTITAIYEADIKIKHWLIT
jgi:hypothetical protein